MESAAVTQMSQRRPGALASNIIRSSTANTAAFGAVDMNPTTGDGAPSYTSGVQTWNGAAATLKPSPTNINAMPRYARIGPEWPAEYGRSASPILAMLVDPVAPNISAT